MIFKIVFGSEIHLYDIKQSYSLTDLKAQIQKMFRKIPNSYQLFYQDQDQDNVYLKCDQDIQNLNDSLGGQKKMIKLFVQQASIEEQNSQKLSLVCQNKICPQLIQSIKSQKANQQIVQSIYSQKQISIQKNQQENFQILKETQIQQKRQEKENEKKEKLENVQNVQNEAGFQRKSNQKARIWEICDALQKEQNKKVYEKDVNEYKKVQSQNVEKQNEQFSQMKHQVSIKDKEVKQIVEKEKDQFHNAKCDHCKVYPITGIRYKCSVCENFDLCQKCQSFSDHSHPFLKIKYTYQTPLSIKVQIELKKEKVVKVEQNLEKLSLIQKKQRINLISSEISQILGLQFKQCYDLVQKNEKYTKQTIMSLIIEELEVLNKKKEQKKVNFWQKFNFWN